MQPKDTNRQIVPKKKVFMVLPSVSESTADLLYWGGNGLVILAGIMGIVGAFGAVWGDRVRDHFGEMRLSENELKTAVANQRAAEADDRAAQANKGAAEANARAAKAENQAADAYADAAKAIASAADAAKRIEPLEADKQPWIVTDRIKDIMRPLVSDPAYKGQPFQCWVSNTNQYSWKMSGGLAEFLRTDCGWAGASILLDGRTFEASPGVHVIGNFPPDNPPAVFNALYRALFLAGLNPQGVYKTGIVPGLTGPPTQPNTLILLISTKPDAKAATMPAQ